MATLNINIDDSSEADKGIIRISTQAEVDAGTDDTKAITPDKLANSDLASDVATNNAKTTNATHTGEVTGSGALTVDSTAISNKTSKATPSGTEEVLINDGGTLKKTTAQAIADLGGGGGASYTLLWQTSTWNPADSNTYYFASAYDLAPNVNTNGNRRNKMPVDATNFTINVGIVCNGSTELVTWTIRNITKGTSANFVDGHAWTSGGQANAYTSTATLSCDADDYISITCDTPAWATNPTSVKINILLNFQAD